jgi:hypothetical protein
MNELTWSGGGGGGGGDNVIKLMLKKDIRPQLAEGLNGNDNYSTDITKSEDQPVTHDKIQKRK